MNAVRFLSATALTGAVVLIPTIAFAQTPGSAATAQVPTVEQCRTDPTTAGCSNVSDSATSAPTRPDTGDTGGARNDDIVVTGSRIRGSSNLDAAVPVTSISTRELLGSHGELSLGDVLSQLPQFRNTLTQANSTGNIGTSGLNLLDLRGLGTGRTLTLVNGRRVVTAVPGSYTPDVNTIPNDLVERVDVVTGGNSAIYGSDAIAGVVNFILRRDYEGVKLTAQGGVTSYGDRGSYTVSGVAGHNFLDGKINVAVSAEYVHQNTLFYADRDYLGTTTGSPAFITSEITTAPNRNFDGIPNTRFVSGFPGSTFSNFSLGGVVQTSCPSATPAAGATAAQIAQLNARRALVCTGQTTPTGGLLNYFYNFNANGSLTRNDPSQGLVDIRPIGGGVLGGLGATGTEGAELDPGLNRYDVNFIVNGNFSSAFKPFAEGTYAHVDSFQQSTQPTFINGTLNPTFSLNNPFLTADARNTLSQIIPAGATSFTLFRLNNDFGDRGEVHSRNTYRAVVGASGDLSDKGSLHYEVSANYGYTDNSYSTQGNVLISNYGNAVNAVAAPAGFTGSNFVSGPNGRVICSINAVTNVDPACFPLNVFGYQAPDPRALNYVVYTSSRKQTAQEIDVQGFISGSSKGFFELPGGPIGFVIGGEYRRESATSRYDAITSQAPALTFLNSSAPFLPPAVNIKEGFAEGRIPLLKDVFLFKELTAEGAVRVSDYGGKTGAVVAWNAGVIYSPTHDLKIRATYARSVRAPNLTNLYASAQQTFANGFTDPCDQPGGPNASNNITSAPNRVARCAQAGVPTTITYTDDAGNVTTRPFTNVPQSGLAGINAGNPNLIPEVGNSFTVGTTYTPHFVPGLTFKIDYYNIRVKKVISGLTGQAIINACYDDPNSTANPFCAVIFRRSTPGNSITDQTFNGQTGRTLDNRSPGSTVFPLAGDGVSFLNVPFNFAALVTRGIDFEASYARQFNDHAALNLRGVISYVQDRQSFQTFTDPTRYERIDQTLGDPSFQGSFNAQGTFKNFDLTYNLRYVGRQVVSGLSYDTFFSVQGRPPLNPEARPFVFYSPQTYHNFRIAINTDDKKFRMYFGVDNAFNKLPPYELTGTGSDAIYPNTGRFFYSGVEVKF